MQWETPRLTMLSPMGDSEGKAFNPVEIMVPFDGGPS